MTPTLIYYDVAPGVAAPATGAEAWFKSDENVCFRDFGGGQPCTDATDGDSIEAWYDLLPALPAVDGEQDLRQANNVERGRYEDPAVPALDGFPAVAFDGVGQWMVSENLKKIGSAAGYTIEAIIRFDDVSPAGAVYLFGLESDSTADVRMETSGLLRIISRNSSGVQEWTTGTTPTTAGWHHLTLTVDVVGLSCKLYYDGVLEVTHDTTTAPNALTDFQTIPPQRMTIAARGASGVGNYADCAFAEIIVWDSVQNAAALATNRAYFQGRYPSLP